MGPVRMWPPGPHFMDERAANMSFASFSTRLESSPLRISDCGEHVDSARRCTWSPDSTCKTGSPAASYQPHATVFGVGSSEYVRRIAGAGHSVAGAATGTLVSE